MIFRAIAVVGASLAGMTAAVALRRAGYAGRLVVFGEERHHPYDRPPLSKELLRGEWQPDQIILRADPAIADVEWRLGTRVTGLHAADRVLRLENGATESYDGIIIATGASPRRLPGSEMAGVHVLRTLDDALTLREDLKRPAARVAVIGAGFIGQEVTAACRQRGLPVTMIEVATPAAHVLGLAVGEIMAQLHRSRGVDVRLGLAVAGYQGRSRLSGVCLADGSVVEADVAVLGIGVRPNTDWLAGSGLAVDDGVVCDETCLAAPGIVAAGDVARWTNRRYGVLRRVEHWDNAVRQAEHAARRLLAGEATSVSHAYTPVPWFWSDQYGLKLQLVGSTYGHDEVRVVHGSAAAEKFVALYRKGDRLMAAVALASTAKLLRYRRLLEDDPLWDDALAMAA